MTDSRFGREAANAIPDVDLELVENRTLDGHIQEFVSDPPSIDPSMWSPSEGLHEDGSSRTDVAHASALSPSEANRWASSVRERTPSLR